MGCDNCARGALIALGLTVSGAARAHVDALMEGVDVVVPVGGGEVAVEASFGLLWPGSDGAWQWTCHEAITAEGALITPRYARAGDGAWLAVVPTLDQVRESGEAVYRSEAGCDWEPVDGLSGVSVSALAVDPVGGQLALAGSASLTDGAVNQLYRSVDGGKSWVATDLGGSERRFRSLRFATGDSGAVWASSVWYGGSVAWVHRSLDGGLTWATHTVAVDATDPLGVSVDVVGVHPTDPDLAWFVRGSYGADEVLRTTDGGSTTEVVFAADGDVLDGGVDADGGVWVVVSGVEVWHAPDGQDFTQVPDAHEGQGLAVRADEVLLASRMTYDGVALSVADRGDPVFETALHVREVTGAASCAADTHAADRCDPLWPSLAKRLAAWDAVDTEDSGLPEDTEPPQETGDPQDSATPAEEDDEDEKKGCAHLGGLAGAGAVWLVALTVAARRRR